MKESDKSPVDCTNDNEYPCDNIQKNQLEYLEIKEKVISKGVALGAPRRVGAIQRPKEIKAVSDTQFTVERDFVKEKLNNIQDLLTQAKAVQTADGFKLISIAPGSLYEAIGLQPGDVITGINDKEVRTQADAIMLYNQFKSANVSRIQLRLTRNGEPVTIGYDLK